MTAEKYHSARDAALLSLGTDPQEAGEDLCPAVPGQAENWTLVTLLHEQAHITGAAEPQADALAALRYRQLLEDQDLEVLIAFRDVRVLLSIADDDSCGENTYGWRCAAALGDALSVPKEDVMSMSVEDIKGGIFKDYDAHKDAIHQLRERVKKAQNLPKDASFQEVYFDDIHDTLRGLLDRGVLDESPTEKYIAGQFCDSFDRLVLGKKPYAPNLTTQFSNATQLAAAQRAAAMPVPYTRIITNKL